MAQTQIPKLATWERAVLRFSRLLPLKVPRALADPGGYDGDIESRAARLYSEFYSNWQPFSGARVAEIGGTGPAALFYLKQGPTKFYIVNVSLADRFRELIAPFIEAGRVAFVRASGNSLPLPDACVDVIISENTFEHLENYPALVADFARILEPGGMLATQFAPLYYSPLGAHLYEVIKLPWLTLFFDWPRVRRMLRYELHQINLSEHYDGLCEQFETLNRLRPKDFREPFEAKTWDLLLFEARPFAWSLRAPEPIRSLLTHKLRIVARKRM